MIASCSFASTADVTQWSNYLTQRAEILTRRSSLTPQRAKNTVNDLSVVPKSLSTYIKKVGFTITSLFFSRDQQGHCIITQMSGNLRYFTCHFTWTISKKTRFYHPIVAKERFKSSYANRLILDT